MYLTARSPLLHLVSVPKRNASRMACGTHSSILHWHATSWHVPGHRSGLQDCSSATGEYWHGRVNRPQGEPGRVIKLSLDAPCHYHYLSIDMHRTHRLYVVWQMIYASTQRTVSGRAILLYWIDPNWQHPSNSLHSWKSRLACRWSSREVGH